MWLLDHNLPVQLRLTLADLGVPRFPEVGRNFGTGTWYRQLTKAVSEFC